MPKKITVTAASTAALAVRDALITEMLEETERFRDDKARMQSLLDESATSHGESRFRDTQPDYVYSGTTFTTESAAVLRTAINNHTVPLPDIISFLCRTVTDYDGWAQALLYLRDVLEEDMETAQFTIDNRSFTETEIGMPEIGMNVRVCVVHRINCGMNQHT